MDQNRYEEVPQKQGVFKRALKAFGRWIKYIVIDFINSFKYNNMKLAGLMVIIPGAIFGFFLHFHALTIRDINFSSTDGKTYNSMWDFSGFILFALMLICILNIFTGFSMMNKKNKGSVIICTISTLVVILCGVAYIYLLLTYHEGGNKFYDAIDDMLKNHRDELTGIDEDGLINSARTLISDPESQYYVYAITAAKRPVINSDWLLSVGSIVFCMISSAIGVVLGFIKYDRTYEKGRDR